MSLQSQTTSRAHADMSDCSRTTVGACGDVRISRITIDAALTEAQPPPSACCTLAGWPAAALLLLQGPLAHVRQCLPPTRILAAKESLSSCSHGRHGISSGVSRVSEQRGRVRRSVVVNCSPHKGGPGGKSDGCVTFPSGPSICMLRLRHTSPLSRTPTNKVGRERVGGGFVSMK